MANEGLYIHNGSSYVLQNNGVCKRLGYNTEAEIYAYNSSGGTFKIYPREQSKNIPPSANGGLVMSTVSQNYGTSWKASKAMQGYFNGYEGNPGQRIGHIFWKNGKPSSSGLIRVDRVKMTIKRNINTGWYNNEITGYLGMSNLSYGDIGNKRFSDCSSFVRNHSKFSFSWVKGGGTTTVDNNSSLNNFIYNFLTTSGAHSLCLDSNESSGIYYKGQRFSANYAGTSAFSIEIWATFSS